MQQTLLWLRTWTVVIVLIALVAAFVIGIILRVLVRRSTLHPSHAIRAIETVSVIAGGVIGSVVVLLLLIILWPAGGNWVINTFLSDTLIWQTEFQQWITQKIDDPTTSSAIGLLIQRIQFGSAFPRIPQRMGGEMGARDADGKGVSHQRWPARLRTSLSQACPEICLVIRQPASLFEVAESPPQRYSPNSELAGAMRL